MLNMLFAWKKLISIDKQVIDPSQLTANITAAKKSLNSNKLKTIFFSTKTFSEFY